MKTDFTTAIITLAVRVVLTLPNPDGPDVCRDDWFSLTAPRDSKTHRQQVVFGEMRVDFCRESVRWLTEKLL